MKARIGPQSQALSVHALTPSQICLNGCCWSSINRVLNVNNLGHELIAIDGCKMSEAGRHLTQASHIPGLLQNWIRSAQKYARVWNMRWQNISVLMQRMTSKPQTA